MIIPIMERLLFPFQEELIVEGDMDWISCALPNRHAVRTAMKLILLHHTELGLK
jgi:hypothetical protein